MTQTELRPARFNCPNCKMPPVESCKNAGVLITCPSCGLSTGRVDASRADAVWNLIVSNLSDPGQVETTVAGVIGKIGERIKELMGDDSEEAAAISIELQRYRAMLAKSLTGYDLILFGPGNFRYAKIGRNDEPEDGEKSIGHFGDLVFQAVVEGDRAGVLREESADADDYIPVGFVSVLIRKTEDE